MAGEKTVLMAIVTIIIGAVIDSIEAVLVGFVVLIGGILFFIIDRSSIGEKKEEPVRKCQFCNTEIPVDAVFCPYCKKKLITET